MKKWKKKAWKAQQRARRHRSQEFLQDAKRYRWQSWAILMICSKHTLDGRALLAGGFYSACVE